MLDANKMRDISREQFEAWHRSVVDSEPPHEKYNNGDYRNQHVQRYWLGWQASRQAVVVNLPALGQPDGNYDESWHHTRNGTIDACKRVIEAQGLKVAP